MTHSSKKLLMAASALGLMAGTAWADQVFLDDVIVDGSLCVGQDCVNGESFGFDTLRLKENNLRIKAQDTSSSASFPSTDWQITFNDSSNGGQNKFSIDDVDGGRTPFTIEASAPANALYVDDGGRIGLGTAAPVVEMHVVNGDSPTMRLEQDGSSGFTPQTWDVAGNESGFFVRDATNGSSLNLRIQPNSPSQALFIKTNETVLNDGGADSNLRVESDADQNALFLDAATGNLGLGTNAPANELHIVDTGNVGIQLESDTTDRNLRLSLSDGTGAGGLDEFRVVFVGVGSPAMMVESDGDVTIAGSLTTGGPTCAAGCDRVFSDDYELKSLEQHAAMMWKNSYLPNVGPTKAGAPLNVAEKIGGMLNELEHAHIYIGQLHGRLAVLEAKFVD